MEVSVLEEQGYNYALLGLSLSYNQDYSKMPKVAQKLASKDGGHNKFLETIVVWLDIRAPRFWWQQFDTFRIGVTKQSESTMHTMMQRKLEPDDFEDITLTSLEAINNYIRAGDFDLVKSLLPEGFLQRRIVCTNYKALRHIVGQRKNHRLKQWHVFCRELMMQLEHPEYLV